MALDFDEWATQVTNTLNSHKKWIEELTQITKEFAKETKAAIEILKQQPK